MSEEYFSAPMRLDPNAASADPNLPGFLAKPAYCDEQAFRFNERKDNDQGRFIKALSGVVGKGLRYAKLIAAEGGDGPCPA